MTISDTPTKPPRRTISDAPLMLLLLIVVALPPLYILSCGPLAALEERVGGDWWDTLFAPLHWLCERWPALIVWLERYIDLWTFSGICNGR